MPNGRSCKWRLQLHHLHRKYATEHIQLCILSAALILQSQLRIKATINRCAQQKQHATSHQQFNIKYKRAESYTGCVGTRTWSDSKIFFSLARTKSCSLFCLVSFFEMPKNSSSARCTILQLELHYKTTVEHMVTKKWSMWTLCGFIMSLQWGWSATIYVWSANNKKTISALWSALWGLWHVCCELFKILLTMTRNSHACTLTRPVSGSVSHLLWGLAETLLVIGHACEWFHFTCNFLFCDL